MYKKTQVCYSIDFLSIIIINYNNYNYNYNYNAINQNESKSNKLLKQHPDPISRSFVAHASLLVDHQGDVFRKLNQAFFLVDSFNSNFNC